MSHELGNAIRFAPFKKHGCSVKFGAAMGVAAPEIA
jgi:hypothetical protein